MNTAIQFASRIAALPDAYAPPSTVRQPRLDLRDVVPDFSDFYVQNIGPYPKTAQLAAALAKELSVDAAQIAITAGGDDALFQVIMSVIEPGKNLVVATPTFPMLARYAAIAGGEMRTVQWLAGDFPMDEFVSQISEDTELILFVSPNNPTGRVVPFEVMQSIRMAAPNALLVLDAVYIEFAERDITQEFLNLPNTLVVRSFSKAYGAAGLRLGYAISKTPEILASMRKVAQPYAVSALSIEMGIQLLQQKPQLMAAIEKIKTNRTVLQDRLFVLGWQLQKSEANFVFLDCRSANVARALFEQMDARGIATRLFPDDPIIANYVRIGVPYRNADLQFLITAFEELKR